MKPDEKSIQVLNLMFNDFLLNIAENSPKISLKVKKGIILLGLKQGTEKCFHFYFLS